MSSTTWLNIYDVTDFRKIASVRDMVSTALQSQYAHSQKFRNIGSVANSNIDISTDIDNAFNSVFNPVTAQISDSYCFIGHYQTFQTARLRQ